MARIYPTVDQVSELYGRRQIGELVVLRWLESVLSDDVEVLYQPYLSGSYPDIVVRVGSAIYILEVKDTALTNYHIDSDANWTTNDNHYQCRNPRIQVLGYRKSLMRVMRNVAPQIDDRALRNTCHPIVVFTNADRFDFDDMIRRSLDRHPIAINQTDVGHRRFNDDRHELRTMANKRAVLFQEDLLSMNAVPLFCAGRARKEVNDQVIDQIWAYLKSSVVASGETEVLSYFDSEQRRWCESKQPRFKLIGPAGSGKTRILMQRAITASANGQRRVLVVHHTNSLGTQLAILKNRLSSYPYCVQIIRRFALFDRLIDDLHLPVSTNIRGSQLWLADVKEWLTSRANMNHTEQIKDVYDDIMIDEVQDFTEDELGVIYRYFLKPGGGWYLFGDNEQNLLGNPLDATGLPRTNIPGRWGHLNRIYRFTGSRASLLLQLHGALFPKSLHSADTPLQIPLSFGDEKISVKSVAYHSENELMHRFSKTFEYGMRSRLRVGVVTENRRLAQVIHDHFSQWYTIGLPCCTLDEQWRIYTQSINRDISKEKFLMEVANNEEVRTERRRKTVDRQTQLYQSNVGTIDKLASLSFGEPTLPQFVVGTIDSMKGWDIDVVEVVISSTGELTEGIAMKIWAGVSRATQFVRVNVAAGCPIEQRLAEIVDQSATS